MRLLTAAESDVIWVQEIRSRVLLYTASMRCNVAAVQCSSPLAFNASKRLSRSSFRKVDCMWAMLAVADGTAAEDSV
jgi:hypothetical protein